ncbi:MAG: amidohydrolase family protein [Bryobacterales bacterium]|nr:amidohydrolase family protein [Bryobacterales bacterium]
MSAPIPAIDSHQHFWNYSAEEYGWIHDGMAALRRGFTAADLHREMVEANVEGAVTVQARQTLEETRWLLQVAEEHPYIVGVVGWAPLADADVEDSLSELAPRRKLKGLRHIVQDEPDDEFLLRADFNAGVSRLSRHGLAYDILVYERHLPYAIEFADRHTDMVFVLDHIAKPRIGDRALEPWRTRILELSERENVYCKISGMVTEADWAGWKEADLRPFYEVVLDAFGPRRLMFGSDWPVLLAAGSYGEWAGMVRRWIGTLTATEQERILRGTAIEAYKL